MTLRAPSSGEVRPRILANRRRVLQGRRSAAAQAHNLLDSQATTTLMSIIRIRNNAYDKPLDSLEGYSLIPPPSEKSPREQHLMRLSLKRNRRPEKQEK